METGRWNWTACGAWTDPQLQASLWDMAMVSESLVCVQKICCLPVKLCETLWSCVKCAALPYSSYVNLALGRPTSFLQVFLAWVFAPFMCLTLSSDFQTLRADHVFFESQVSHASRASHANQAHRRYWCSLERKVKIGGKFGCSRCWHAAWRGPVRKKNPSLSMATERSLKWPKMRYLEVFFGNRSDGKPENHGLKSQ